MSLFDRIKQWASSSDEDKVALDRRAFLKGMAVTSAGLLVPTVAFFDMGHGILKPGPALQDAYEGGGLNPCGEIRLSGFEICGLRPGDEIKVSGMSGAIHSSNGIYRVATVTNVAGLSGASSSMTVRR